MSALPAPLQAGLDYLKAATLDAEQKRLFERARSDGWFFAEAPEADVLKLLEACPYVAKRDNVICGAMNRRYGVCPMASDAVLLKLVEIHADGAKQTYPYPPLLTAIKEGCCEELVLKLLEAHPDVAKIGQGIPKLSPQMALPLAITCQGGKGYSEHVILKILEANPDAAKTGGLPSLARAAPTQQSASPLAAGCTP